MPKILLAVAIVSFWATMTTWLVRAHWNDGNAPFSDMSPRLVIRQALKHEVTSSLGIFQGHRRIGSVTVTPLHNPAHAVSLDGNIAIPQSDGKAETFNFSFRMDLSEPILSPKMVTLRFSQRQQALNVFLEVLFSEQKIRYQIKNGLLDPGIQEIPLASNPLAGFAPGLVGLPSLPIDPATWMRSLECRANRASFQIRGERMDGYRLKVSAIGASATVTLGQLGEIYILQTSTGYHLLADGLDAAQYLP